MSSEKSKLTREEKDDDDADKSGKNMKTRQETRENADKRERETEQEKEMKTARNQGMIDVSSPGASSSHQTVAPATGGTTSGKRTLE